MCFISEISVLGSRSLSKLKDAFVCSCDLTQVGAETADSKFVKMSPLFFYIGQTFYVDERDPKALDYSQPIRDRLNETSDCENLFSKTSMSTLVRDLSVS